jgi:DnaJ-class molecular chaperone
MWDDPRKMICPDCNGNGYLGSSNKPKQQEDCTSCNNQGEVIISEEMLSKLRDSGL